MESDGSRPNGADPETIGTRVRQERLRRGIGVRELARCIGVSASLISQVELGKATPSVGTLYAIGNQLELSLDELLLRVPPAASPPPRSAGRSREPADTQPPMPAGESLTTKAAAAANPEPVVRHRSGQTIQLADGV